MRVGIIGDTHIPYELDGYLAFCKRMFKKHEVNKVVHIGDLVDHHALSFHDSEPMLKGANGELIDAREALRPWYKAFPKLTLILGNHDLIPARQLKKVGMDSEVWMRPLQEVYDMPPGWVLRDELLLDNVLYHHGYTAMGVNGYRNDAILRQCSTVSGHAHGNMGIAYTACDRAKVFGMAVGCGIDRKAMAYVYGRHFKYKPLVGCGIVLNGKPIIEAMDL